MSDTFDLVSVNPSHVFTRHKCLARFTGTSSPVENTGPVSQNRLASAGSTLAANAQFVDVIMINRSSQPGPQHASVALRQTLRVSRALTPFGQQSDVARLKYLLQSICFSWSACRAKKNRKTERSSPFWISFSQKNQENKLVFGRSQLVFRLQKHCVYGALHMLRRYHQQNTHFISWDLFRTHF